MELAAQDDVLVELIRRGQRQLPVTEGLVVMVKPARFGSDWPVCLLAASYRDMLKLTRAALRPGERAAVLSGTPVRVYGLSPG
jgi:L-fuconolactonase